MLSLLFVHFITGVNGLNEAAGGPRENGVPCRVYGSLEVNSFLGLKLLEQMVSVVIHKLM